MKKYNIFISHSWTYDEHYEGLINFLDSDRNFIYKDYSVPKDDPIHNAKNKEKLREAIERQIRLASVVLIPAGAYVAYSEWINIEIDIAKKYEKPIIAIKPRGAEKTSCVAKESANQIVGWNSASIIEAIKEEVK